MMTPIQPLSNIKLSFKCPKQLNELQPCNGDWYCDGCQKIVHDFRGMSETQILAVINTAQKPCGIFEAGRIEVLPRQSKWRKWIPAAILTFAMSIIQSCTDNSFFPIPNSGITNHGMPSHTVGIILLPPPPVSARDSEMLTYLYQNLSNPHNIKDTVNVRYTIDEHGAVTNVKVLNSKHRRLNA